MSMLPSDPATTPGPRPRPCLFDLQDRVLGDPSAALDPIMEQLEHLPAEEREAFVRWLFAPRAQLHVMERALSLGMGALLILQRELDRVMREHLAAGRAEAA